MQEVCAKATLGLIKTLKFHTQNGFAKKRSVSLKEIMHCSVWEP